MSYGDELDEDTLYIIKDEIRKIIRKKDEGSIRTNTQATDSMVDAIKKAVKEYDN